MLEKRARAKISISRFYTTHVSWPALPVTSHWKISTYILSSRNQKRSIVELGLLQTDVLKISMQDTCMGSQSRLSVVNHDDNSVDDAVRPYELPILVLAATLVGRVCFP